MGDVKALGMDTVTEKSGHQVTGMAVSVCTTPAAPSPLPIPYPTMGTVGEGIVDEPLRTKINGAKHATVGSCVKVCHGNEAGTLKEVVSLNTAGPSFLTLGAPTVFCELGMMGITGSLVQMNKAITVGAPGQASGAGGGAGGGGGGGGGGGAGGPSGPSGPGGGGGGGGGSNTGASPPSNGAPSGNPGQAAQGHPVDVVTGAVFTPPTVDFALAGFFRVEMVREYRSPAVRRRCGMGWGWMHSLAWRAQRHGDSVTVIDHEGRPAVFALPAEGQMAQAPFGRSLLRQGENLVLDLQDGLLRVLRPAKRNQYLLAQVRDHRDHVAELEWDGDEVVAITDTVGRRVAMYRDGMTRTWIASVNDADGVEHRRVLVVYELDEAGDLVRVVDAGGADYRYAYDDAHYLLSETRPDGVVYRFRYEDVAGERRCVETWGELPGRDLVTELRGSTSAAAARGIYHSRFEYDPERQTTTVIDAEGGVHRYVGNDLGLVSSYTDPRGHQRDFTYDDRGNLLATRYPDGTVESSSYDARGRLVAFADGMGRRISLTRGAADAITSVTDPAGGKLTIQVDDRGRPTERVDALGGKTLFEYDEHGSLVSVVAPDGAQESRTYDAHGNLHTFTNARGASYAYTHDLFGLPVRIETPLEGCYELGWDSRGDLISTRAPAGKYTEFQRDHLRQVVGVRDTGGQITALSRLAGVLVEQKRTDGLCFRYGWDALLRPVWIENPAGERQTYTYDACSNIIRETTFGGQVTEYEYDSCNRCTKMVAPDGTIRQYAYNRSGQLVQRESGALVETFEYDALGMVVRAVSGITAVTFQRDALGRVVRETQEAGGWRFAVDRALDSRGWVTERRYASGWGVSLERGEGSVVSRVRVEANERTAEMELDYDGLSAEIERRFGSSVVRTVRDELGRPCRISVNQGEVVVRERAYTWDEKGPVSRIVDSERGSRSYELDQFGRPLRVSGMGMEERYQYGPHGVPQREGTAAIGPGGRPLASPGAVWRWDGAGRLAARVGQDPRDCWTYEYDATGHMNAAVRGDGLAVRYLYDAFGRRLCETREDGTSAWFGWDEDSPVEERWTTGRTVRRVFHDDGYTALLESDGGATFRSVVNDGASTPWLYLAASGESAELELSAWGTEVRKRADVGALRFAGQRADDTTGLSYQRFRYYAPELGVFTTPDPLGLAGGAFEVGFVPNVTVYLDPLGLVIVVMSDDPPCPSYAQARAAATGQQIVHHSQLGIPGALAGESNVDLISHGAPGLVQMGVDPATGRRAIGNGDQMGAALRNAGFTGNMVHMTVCEGGTDAPGRPGSSVAQGIANQTGATTVGCVGAPMTVDRHLPHVSVACPGGTMTPFYPQRP
ncbi:MAG: DUF4150 domain-containing protein [Polyangiaceae bacterium]|nr:DUF4150 domain-containing protein [Polyangiaceae bacterium]